MANRFVLGRAAEGIKKASRSALLAPPPADGEIRRTALPDTFDGIRFEIGRMIEYVKQAARDPLVVEHTRAVCQEYFTRAEANARMNGSTLAGEDDREVCIRAIDGWCRDHFAYVNDPPNVEVLQTPRRMIKQTRVPGDVVKHVLGAVFETMGQVVGPQAIEEYQPPALCMGDCLPLDQKILVRNRSDKSYGVVEIGSLKDRSEYYHVVSYNETERHFEFKPITRFTDKGHLRVFKVSLSNGISFRCSERHEIYVFRRDLKTGSHELVTMTIGQLVSERNRAKRFSGRYTIPTAIRIPEAQVVHRDRPNLSAAQLWVEGLYVAEGWAEARSGGVGRRPTFRAKIGMNNPHAITALKTNLATMGQEYGDHLRADGLITVRINASEFSSRLGHCFGRNSAEKKFPEWYASMNRDELTTLLSSYALGDGYVPTHGQWLKLVRLVYNTKSQKLAEQLHLMHLVLGRPLSIYHQPAWKTKPAMYRLYEYFGNSKEKLPELGSAKIKSIEEQDIVPCCDITVADNHNFLLDGGVLVHNCDEGGLLFNSKCATAPAPIRPIFFEFGGHDGTLHHVWSLVGIGEKKYRSDLTEPDYQLGDYSKFEHYENTEIPL